MARSEYNIRLLLLELFLLIGCNQSIAQTVNKLFPGDSVLVEPYGITSHITWKGYDYDNYQTAISEVSANGTDFIRTDFNQGSINWGKANQSFSIWDNVVRTAVNNGVQIAPLVYPARYDKYTLEEDRKYSGYLKECLHRYGNVIDSWEIWNEMDILNSSDGKVSPGEYLPMLKSSYRIIKENNPYHAVLLGAIGDLSKPYFEELLNKGAADYYDITSVHYYSARNVPEAILPFYEKVGGLFARYGVRKPIWLTETGYRTFTADNRENPDLFYSEVLPQVYKQLGIKCSKVELAVLLDSSVKKYLRNQDNPVIHTGFKGVKAVGFDELALLDVKSYPVLMILFGESFPMMYFENLHTYIARGGTVVFPEGGASLYYDLNLETNGLKGVSKNYYKRLHIGCMFSWDAPAKEQGVKSRMIGVRLSNTIRSQYTWTDEDLKSPKYFTEENLQPGDKMITIIEGYDEGYAAPVAVCYRLNSDLKGNVIIQTRSNNGDKISEQLQAIRYPRLYLLSFASGIDKVFGYCLTDRNAEKGGYGILHKDLSRKQVFYSLQTLTQKCPSGSSRPTIKVRDHQYIASWKKPNGKTVYAVWSDRLGLNGIINVTGRAKYYDCFGKRIRKSKFIISPSVFYIEGAKSVSFEIGGI